MRIFGVMTDDLELARQWVESATGLVGKHRDHIDMGGEYYGFYVGKYTAIILQGNIDIVTGYPFTSKKNKKWRLIVELDDTDEGGKIAAALQAAPTRFTFLDGEVEL
ncbi:MAG: hypothetical protein ABL908_13810 [Hyphomicrobium sp.]